ncbi:hypothetical protein OIU79_016922 [Salix purpurea]|uniref:Uncharacterized protein n=1 Tax=Salix purpurea TaxID=77065 RepID=A0A9Q0WUJ2_SALPP|nr:hypothetical protein OIU79_016922 [Salix purpurea]
MKVAAVSSYSILVDATLVRLRIVLTIILERILPRQPEPEIGLGLAHLFHLVPCYLALVRCRVSLACFPRFYHFLLYHLCQQLAPHQRPFEPRHASPTTSHACFHSHLTSLPPK